MSHRAWPLGQAARASGGPWESGPGPRSARHRLRTGPPWEHRVGDARPAGPRAWDAPAASGYAAGDAIRRQPRPDSQWPLQGFRRRLGRLGGWPRHEAGQAAATTSAAMGVAWACVSRPPIFQTCPFLIIAIASWPASARRAVRLGRLSKAKRARPVASVASVLVRSRPLSWKRRALSGLSNARGGRRQPGRRSSSSSGAPWPPWR